MKKIKVLLSLFIACISLFLFTSCKEKEKYSIYLPDGTPALACANILGEYSDKYNIHIVKASEIASSVALDDCDMAILPTTAAATLVYKKNIGIKMVSNNVFGNLYIVSVNGGSSLKDLYNSPIYATIGTTLDLLKYLLTNNDISYQETAELNENKTSIISKSDASEIIPLLALAKKQGKRAYAVLGEPAVTSAINKVEGLKISFDMQKLYEDITGADGYPQACFVAKNEMIDKHKDVIIDVFNLMKSNVNYLQENVTRLSELFKKYDSTLQNTSFCLDLIRRSNIRAEKAVDIKDTIYNYIYSLTSIEVKDDFYFNF